MQMGVQPGLILMHLLQLSTFNSTFLALLRLLGINASTARKCFDFLHHPGVDKRSHIGSDRQAHAAQYPVPDSDLQGKTIQKFKNTAK